MDSPDLVFVLLLAAFLVGALLNMKRFGAYALMTLLLVTPLYATVFMPRAVFGVTGLNFWNVVWLGAVAAAFLPAKGIQQAIRGPAYFAQPIAIFAGALLIATVYGMTVAHEIRLAGPGDPVTPVATMFQGWLKPMQFWVLGWLVYRHCLVSRDVRPVSRVLLISVILFGALVLYFYWKGSSSGYVDPYGTYVIGRDAVSAMSGMHANDVGALATYGLVFSVLWQERSAPWSYVRRAAIVMAILTIVFSFSRTAYVTAPLVLLLSFKSIPLKEKIAAMLVVALVVVYAAPLLIERVSFRADTRDVNQISAERIDGIWKPLWNDVEERPFLGAGRFAQIRSKYFTVVRVSHAHSAYLQLLLEMGIVGLAIVGFVLKRLYSVGRKAQTSLPYLLVAACLVGIMGHSFIPDASNYVLWVVYATSLAGIAIAKAGASEMTSALAAQGHFGPSGRADRNAAIANSRGKSFGPRWLR